MTDGERVVHTQHGPLRVSAMREELVEFLGSKWPLPIATCVPREDAHTTHNRNATFIVPFDHEGRHVNLIYLAQTPRRLAAARATAARTLEQADRILLAVLRAGFPGMLVQMSTLREAQGVGVPGLALVVGSGRDSGEDDPNPLALVLELIRAGELEFELVTKPKYVPPSVAGELSLGFGVLEGKLVICFKPELDPADPSLARLVAAGVEHLYHMPVTGTAFPSLGAPVLPPTAPPADMVEEVSPNGLRRIYRLLANLAACDGTVDPAERALLNGLAEHLQLGAAEVEALEAEGFAGKSLKVGKNPVERELLMLMLIDMAFADGVLDPQEKKRLKAFADKVGLPRDELRRRLDERTPDPERALEVGGERPASPESPEALRRIYRLMCFLGASDGGICEQEEELLLAFRKRYGLSEDEAFLLREQALRGEELAVGAEAGEHELLLDELVAISVADGVVTQDEAHRLRRFCEVLRIPVGELNQRLREQMQRYADAQEQEQSEARAKRPQDAAEWGRLILLDVPGELVGLNLLRVPVEEGFQGFKYVEPGVHRVSVPLADGREVAHWIRILPGEVEVLAFDGQDLAVAPSARWNAVQRQALAGELDERLRSFIVQLSWRTLTAPLLDVHFPPVVFEPADLPPRRRLLNALANHEGSANALLAELAYTFLVALLDRQPVHHQRWSYLVQGFYHCADAAPEKCPGLYRWAVDLLIAQQGQLPPEILGSKNAITRDSHFLGEDLIETGVPELVEAGRRWGVFVAGHHAGAPPAGELPASMARPTVDPESPFGQALEENARELEDALQRLGPTHPELLKLYSFRGSIQEAAGDVLGALESQERQLEVGTALGNVPGALLAQGHMRLARLLREAGRADDARAAERTAQRLALDASRLN